MTESDRIEEMLLNAGVYREAFLTTLVKEKLPALREYVSDTSAVRKKVVYLYHNDLYHTGKTHGEKAELALHLMAKEMLLSGNRTLCCRLVDLHTMLFRETEEAEALASCIESYDNLAIQGFHDAGGRVEQFMSPYEIAYFISWFIRRVNTGHGFLLLGAASLAAADGWWPASFLGYLRSRAEIFEVR